MRFVYLLQIIILNEEDFRYIDTFVRLLNLVLMLYLPENHSPIFANKSKVNRNTTNNLGCGANNQSHDIVEHDVACLKNMNNLPSPDAFEALQLSTER